MNHTHTGPAASVTQDANKPRAAATTSSKAVALLVALSLLAAASPCGAIELFFNQFEPSPDAPDSTNPSNPTGINGVYSSAAVIQGDLYEIAAADDFAFESDTSTVALKRMVFWTLEENDPPPPEGSGGGAAIWDKTLRYAIWQDANGMPGTILASPNAWGEFTPDEVDQGAVTKTLLRSNIHVNQPISTEPDQPNVYVDQYEYSFALESLVGLSSNTRYWISIYLGLATNLTHEQPLSWQQTVAGVLEDQGFQHANPFIMLDASGNPPNTPAWNNTAPPFDPNRQIANLRFQLVADAPIPNTFLLMLTMIIFGAAQRGLVRRRSA